MAEFDPAGAVAPTNEPGTTAATDYDLTNGGSYTIINGVVFTDAANTGSGTGNYNTFLALQDNNDAGSSEAGFNTDDTPPIDSSNVEIDQSKTHTVLLSSLVVTTIDGVDYYEFRVDLNENNSDPNAQISLDTFQIYSSSLKTIESLSQLQGQNLIYDLDSGGVDRDVLLSEAGSTGSGTDDYAVLIPVSSFDGLDPTSTYIYLYSQFGAAGQEWGANGGFEEWNLQNGVTLSGIKFDDANGNGILDTGETGIGGVTIFIDTDRDGELDADERSTVTASDGTYSFYGVALLDQTLWIDEVIPAGMLQTTGDHETVTISSKGTAGSTITVDPIGNFLPVPAIDVTKSVTSITSGNGNALADSAGDIITYAITIANSGNVALTGVDVDDEVESYGAVGATYVSGDSNTNSILDVGETWTYSAIYTLTQDDLDNQGGGDGTLDNVATGDTDQTGPDSDDASVPLVYNPAIDVTKSVTSITGGNGNALADADGDLITYAITIANTGNISLTNIDVEDEVESYGAVAATYVSGDSNTNSILDVGESWTYSATYTLTQDDLNNQGGGDGTLDNVATGTTDQVGPDSDDASVPLVYNPAIDVTKSVTSVTGGNGNALADSAGDLITYAITIANTGNISLTNVDVDDEVESYGAVGATYVSGDSNTNSILDVGETWTYSATYTLIQDDLDNQGGGDGTLDNVATGTTDQVGPDSDDASVPLVYNPSVDLEKYVSVAPTTTPPLTSDPSWADADTADLSPENVNLGAPVYFMVTVANTGNVTLTNPLITDVNTSNGGNVSITLYDGTTDTLNSSVTSFTGDTDGDGNIDVGETWTMIYSQAFDAGDHVNTATVTTTGVTDSDAAHYFSLVNDGPGVRTPGFWQNMKNGGQFWDGVDNNEKNAGKPCFPDGELLYMVDSNNDGTVDTNMGLLIGDYNHNGLTDADEDTLFISYADARYLINANNQQMSDGVVKIGRDIVATWLNTLAGNGIGAADDAQSPHHFIDDAIDYLQMFGDATAGVGSTTETFDIYSSMHAGVKTGTSAWTSDYPGGDHSGSEIHSALDYYNNTGMTSPTSPVYAHDCDDPNFVSAITVYEHLI